MATTPPTDPANAQLTNETADKANELSAKLASFPNFLENIGKSAIEAFGKTGASIKALIDDIKTNDIEKIFNNISKSIENMGTRSTVQFRDSGAAINSLSDNSDRLLERFVKLGALTPLKPMFDNLKDVGAPTITTTGGSIKSLTEQVSRFGGTISSDVLGVLAKLGDKFLANAAQAEKFENAFVGLASSAGNMNELFEGGNLVDLSAKTQNYANQVSNAADATGQGVTETMDFANALKQLPGFLDQTISSGDGADNKTKALISTMTLMTGTGRSQQEVIKALDLAYDKLGTSTGRVSNAAQKGAEFLSDVSSVANTLKLKFTDVNDVMEKIAAQFEFVGDNSNDAARVLSRYTDALRETGLTGKASMDIVNGMVGSIEKMTIGTKAFLSLRSGGPGGLQGAFQIDQLLRQGKLDQVVQMAERSLRQQFGGRIFTQEEAASSPQAAAQFMRQRSLLQSGAFGIGQGASNEQATRLLEALGKRDFGSITKELKTGQDAVKQATDRGTQIQTRNNDLFKQINRNVDRATIAMELSAGLQLKQLVGTAGGRAGQITQGMTNARERAVDDISRKADATSQQAFTKEQVLSARQTISQTASIVEGLTGTAKEAGSKVKQDIIDSANDVRGILGKKGPTPEEAVIDTTITPPQRATQTTRPSQNAPRAPIQTIATSRGLDNRPRETDARRTGVYTDAVQRAGLNQQRPTAAVTTANREALKTQALEIKPLPPQKVVLEIIAPPGFGVQTKSAPNNIEITNGAAAGINNGK